MSILAQIIVSLFGVASFLLVIREGRRAQIAGTVCGFIACPAWWTIAILDEQWLTIPVHLAYTLGWIDKARRLYLKK